MGDQNTGDIPTDWYDGENLNSDEVDKSMEQIKSPFDYLPELNLVRGEFIRASDLIRIVEGTDDLEG